MLLLLEDTIKFCLKTFTKSSVFSSDVLLCSGLFNLFHVFQNVVFDLLTALLVLQAGIIM